MASSSSTDSHIDAWKVEHSTEDGGTILAYNTSASYLLYIHRDSKAGERNEDPDDCSRSRAE